MKLEQIQVIVSGRVQGVGFRYHTQRAAERIGITGWVKNLPDGTVQALAEGKPEQIDAFLAWCQEGPEGSHVVAVKTLERTNIERPSSAAFKIER